MPGRFPGEPGLGAGGERETCRSVRKSTERFFPFLNAWGVPARGTGRREKARWCARCPPPSWGAAVAGGGDPRPGGRVGRPLPGGAAAASGPQGAVVSLGQSQPGQDLVVFRLAAMAALLSPVLDLLQHRGGQRRGGGLFQSAEKILNRWKRHGIINELRSARPQKEARSLRFRGLPGAGAKKEECL